MTARLSAALLLASTLASAQEPPKSFKPRFEKGKSAGGVQGAAVGGPAGAAGGLSACTFAGELLSAVGKPALYRDQGGWKLYTPPSVDDRAQPNSTYLCLHGDLALFFQGVVGAEADAIAVDGGHLRVRTAIVADAAPRNRYMAPPELEKVAVDAAHLQLGDGAKRPLEVVAEHYIPTAGLRAAVQTAPNMPLAAAEKVAWAKVERNYLADGGKTKSVRVFVRPGEDAAASASKALSLLASDTVCAPKGIVAADLASYLKKAAADPKLQKGLEAFAADSADPARGIMATPPSFMFSCRASGAAGDYDVAMPSWNLVKALRARDGRIDSRSGY
jgi:hypothetical protein